MAQYDKRLALGTGGETTEVSVEIDIPEEIAQRALEISKRRDSGKAADYIDEVCLWDVTYCVDGEPIFE